MPGYFLGRASQMPPQGRINAGQKLHHLGIGIMSLVVVSTGLTLWLGKGQPGANSLAITAMLHDVSMLALTILFVGHVYFTLVYGALPAVLNGYVPESYAKLEHSKWLATLPQRETYIFELQTGRPPAVTDPGASAKESAPCAPNEE